jgi:hypothetical protein
MLLIAILAAVPVAAQDEEQPTPEQIEQFQKLAAPGEHHKHLGALEGKWSLVFKGGPGGDAKGTATYRWILGDRFLVEEVKTELFGQTFEWIGTYGYSNQEKKYTATWIDNFGTDTEIGEGQCSDEGKVFTFSGDGLDPMSGERYKFKWVIALEGKDKMTTTMYIPGPDDKDTKLFEIVGTREK